MAGLAGQGQEGPVGFFSACLLARISVEGPGAITAWPVVARGISRTVDGFRLVPFGWSCSCCISLVYIVAFALDPMSCFFLATSQEHGASPRVSR